MVNCAEYIWIDGAEPTRRLRSKTRILKVPENPSPSDFMPWNYDGSSTFQAPGKDSDLGLQPVHVVPDPIRGKGHFLVLCEVLDTEGAPHETNNRARLRQVLDQGGAAFEPWVGFEQEYTLYKGRDLLGWPEGGYLGPQGMYYCGVGPKQVFGRDFVEAHTKACLEAGLMIHGTNAEALPAQWEYQIGPRNFEEENNNPLRVCDEHWIARWLLWRVGENYDLEPSLENKPVKGDWNGSGQHANFSTRDMRDPSKGMKAIEDAIASLALNHSAHIAAYGANLEERLTGLHETCGIHEFRHGIAHRGASIRIPRQVYEKRHGYIEDRRPGANADPYLVATALIRTICKVNL